MHNFLLHKKRQDRSSGLPLQYLAEGEGLEPPWVLPRRISSALPYQLGLALHEFSSCRAVR